LGCSFTQFHELMRTSTARINRMNVYASVVYRVEKGIEKVREKQSDQQRGLCAVTFLARVR
ncbi:MAG TPA: hypothetical protein VNL69_09545, partial [Bacteroidota bacterium]|nr:hypothetical protein [Bacteroidota bacterium]